MKFVLITRNNEVILTGTFIAPMIPPPEIMVWGSRTFSVTKVDLEWKGDASYGESVLVPDHIQRAYEEDEAIAFYREGLLWTLIEGVTAHLDIYTSAKGFGHEIEPEPEGESEAESDEDHTDGESGSDGSTSDDAEG